MMAMTASTANSLSLWKAPRTSSCVGKAMGSSVMAYPSSAAEEAIASRVHTLPVVERVNRMTPTVRNSPRFKARAALLGR